ncbi:MAG: transaldolase [Chloroflexota bacterium]
MSLFLDSANPEDARQAQALGCIAGITTNPTLIAQTGRPAFMVIRELCELTSGPVFYQLTRADYAGMLAEAEQADAISPGQVVMKVPCTWEGLRAVCHLRGKTLCAVTAVFTPAQAYLAAEAGARYIIPYVNRATRLLGDGPALVQLMAAVLQRGGAGYETEILAASIKSPEEAVAALLAGAQHLTLPLAVILQMAESPYTAQALAEFASGH